MKRLNLFRIFCITMVMGALILGNGLVYAASDKGNQGNHGQGNNGQGQGNQDQGNNGQGNQGQARGRSDSAPGQSQASTNSQAVSHTSNSEVRRNTIERGRDQANLRANRPEKTNQAIGKNHEKGTGVRRALEKARWSYHPKDERGQGNMGKVDMRDPYGFDKDSGREGSERGRPIHDFVLNLADIIGIDFNVGIISYYEYLLALYQSYAQRYPQYASMYTRTITYYTNMINYLSSLSYTKLAVNLPYNTINYTMTFAPPENLEGTTLLVTTSLVSATDYNFYYQVYNSATRTWERINVHYDAGQTIMQQTQEVALSADNTYSFSYDPPTELASYSGFYANLSVTVTEPVSGATYTMTYDQQIYLYRCPYGKVSDTKTSQPIVGAKVSVHFEDGALVPLDKASNPTASNPQTTDATGRYGFKLETNRKYYISVAAPGYQDYKSPMFTEKWHVLREDIKLIPIIK